jgi:hypothetical protein
VVENSHSVQGIPEKSLGFDVVRNSDHKASIDDHPADFARGRGTRLLTARSDDVLVFGMYTMHGALEHHANDHRIGLTTQRTFAISPARRRRTLVISDPTPDGTNGAGYGELNGARPLTEDWHIR